MNSMDSSVSDAPQRKGEMCVFFLFSCMFIVSLIHSFSMKLLKYFRRVPSMYKIC